MNSEVSASFRIMGQDLDPESISRATGIDPTEIWRIGDRVVAGSTLQRRENCWEIKSSLGVSEDVNAHVESLIRILRRSWQKFVELGRTYDAEFSCVVVSVRGESVPLYFDKDTVQQAAELNAELDVDLIFLA